MAMQQVLSGAEDGLSPDEPSAARLWQAALVQLQLQVTRPIYDTYLRDTAGLRIADGRLVVGAASDFAVEWLTIKLQSRVMQTLHEIRGEPVAVTFEVLGAPSLDGASAAMLAVETAIERGTAQRAAEQVDGDAGYRPPRLNERYTFATFVEGENNRLALAACAGAAERPGQTYNPIFIYGGVGLGKTHLMHAMGHALLARGMRVIYVTSEQFTNDFVAAIRGGRNEEFRARYRTADLLLIDDVQFIAGKEGTMEEFFHTFNDLHSHGRQIVITSDQPPKKVKGLEDRLISRFEWGLIADIQPPGQELRLAILQEKARVLGRELPEEVLAFIAERVRENVRELEGSLNRVLAYADLTGTALTLDLAARALGELPVAQRRLKPAPEEILDAVGTYFQVRPAQLAGQGRDKRLAHARQVAMYLLREDGGLPLQQIGRILGKRDHTTVLHGCKKIDEARVLQRELRQQLEEIRASLGGR